MSVVNSIVSVALTVAPWLLLGLFASGLMKALLPTSVLKRFIGGEGIGGITRAAIMGAPLPLCSCGAIPAALTLYRAGAGRGPATAFLIATPGIGLNSLAVSYVLLGPVMMIARAIGAALTAIVTGLLMAASGQAAARDIDSGGCCAAGCGAGGEQHSDTGATGDTDTQGLCLRLRAGMGYAFNELLQDIGPWLLGGLVIAGTLIALVPPQALANYGSGLPAMLLMAVIGAPLYICAAAATPIAAGMILAGVSAGTVLVFLLAGPITSAATLALLRREFGNSGLLCYFIGIVSCAIALGLGVDVIIDVSGLDVIAQAGAVGELLPAWIEVSALLVLLGCGSRPLLRKVLKRLLSRAPH